MSLNTPIIRQLDDCKPDSVADAVHNVSEPVLLKGLTAGWPIVQAGLESEQTAADYIQRYDANLPLTVYEGAKEIQGRIFYNDDFSGFNFSRSRKTLSQVLGNLFEHIDDVTPPTWYVGSTMVDHWLPGFRAENDLGLDELKPLVSLWLGNQSRIAAHYDFPNNIACCVVGQRRFTLFPPDQLANLYIGPLDMTPSGQPISLVDFKNPDYQKYPLFKQALESAYIVDMQPGDALFIPSMWWHHVEALSAFNVLINYWWRPTPEHMGSPLAALQHAMLSLRELPAEQRTAWQDIFNHYVFEPDEKLFSHIPQKARGVLSGVDENSAQQIRQNLLRLLK